VRATCLRRTKALSHLSATLKLPGKIERVETVELAPDERELYDFFKRRSYLLAHENSKTESEAGAKANAKALKRQRVATTKTLAKRNTRKSAGNIIVLLSVLRMICDHGEALLPRVALEAWRNRDDHTVSWALLQTTAGAEWNCCVCGQEISREEEKQDIDMIEFSCKKHVACEACITTTEDAVPTCPKCSITHTVSSVSASPRSDSPSYGPSSKVSALLRHVLCTVQNKISSSTANPPVKRYVP
jgi:SWI/SNF-related matrix-associated actin-dependent regulator of chromatin subfamily A3